MSKQNKTKHLNRRRFIGTTLTAAAAYSFMPKTTLGKSLGFGMANPDSTFGGVSIGTITYSYRSLPGSNAKETLDYLLQSGLSSCELMSSPVETTAGAPVMDMSAIMGQMGGPGGGAPGGGAPGGGAPGGGAPGGGAPGGGAPGGGAPGGGGGFQMPEGMREAMAKAQEETSEWRESMTSMAIFKEIREMYNDAGVDIRIVKFDNIGQDGMSAKELEYMFNVAKALGARGITTELDEAKAKNLGCSR